MNKAEQDGRLTGLHLTASCPSIQHLLFEDDSLFLRRATIKEYSEFLNCLRLYGKASGQEINFQKSAITFGKKIDPCMKHLLGLFTGIEQEGGTGKYLGLPECFSGSKRELMGFITDRLKSRLSSWYEKTLSLGGKEVLIKYVALALPVYAMSCFRLTKHQCKKITSAMSNFWWNESEEKHKMHWVSWEKICKSKAQGGLGFRDIGRFNQALLAKQAWRLLDVANSLLARVYKARYYSQKTIIEATSGYRPSYAWRSNVFGKELLECGLIKTIGNGQSTGVWTDKWLVDRFPRRPINNELLMDLELKVSSLITAQGKWNLELLNKLFPASDVIQIRSFPPEPQVEDRCVWAYTKDGQYSVKSGNWVLNREAAAMDIVSDETKALNKVKENVWLTNTAPKIRLFLWRALFGALAVADCMRSHGLVINTLCPVCLVKEETVSHVLFECPLAASVWQISTLPQPENGFTCSTTENILHLLQLRTRESLPANMRAAIPWILWGLWKARNSSVFVGKNSDPNVLLASAMEDAEEWTQQNTIMAQEMRLCVTRNPMRETAWRKPPWGSLKCNLHASWVRDSFHCGGAWILRDHFGDVVLHARDAFLPMTNRIAAELHCILWCLQSLHDLHFDSCEIWSDCSAAIRALDRPRGWPKYRSLLFKIAQVIQVMWDVKFKISSPKANSLAKDIACSVTRDGRFTSYLASGGPSWLHDRIEDERRQAPYASV